MMKATRTKMVPIFMLASGVMQGQSPAIIYTHSVTRKEGEVRGSRTGRVLKCKLSRECPGYSSFFVLFHNCFLRLGNGFLDMQIPNRRVWEQFLAFLSLLHHNLALVSPVPLGATVKEKNFLHVT